MDTLIKDMAESINENLLKEEDEMFEKAWEKADINMEYTVETPEGVEEFFRKVRSVKW